MHAGLVSTLFVCVVGVVVVDAGNLPPGILAIPPLPIQLNPPYPTKATPKPTVKFPPTKKTNPTKPPFNPTTTKPTLPPTQAPSLPPSKSTPTSSNNCQYAINVPKANCNGGNTAMQQALSSLKQELDKTRNQHQAQNAQVQSKISQLQNQQSGYLNKISDLQNEVKNLVSAFNSLSCQPSSTTPPSGSAVTPAPTSSGSTGSGNVNPGLQQAILAVRSDLRQAVRDFNNKLQGFNVQMQNNSMQSSQVDIQIESQILKQGQDIGKMIQQIADLQKQLQRAQANNGTGSGITNQDVAKLQAKIQKISADIQQYDQTQQAKFNTLSTKAAALNAQVANHTNDIQGFRTRVLVDESRINTLDNNVTIVYTAFKQFLANFRRTTSPQIRQVEADVKDLIANSTSMKNDIDRVGKSTLNILLQTSKDRQTLKGVEAQANNLQSKVANISIGLTQQSNTISQVQKDIKDLTKSVPVSALTKMNNVVLTILNNPNQTATPQQLTDLKDGINAIQRALNTTFPSIG